jgi:hypothetical protein
MKRDLTTTGRMTIRGRVQDLVSYTKRYIFNNYNDKHFQLGLNLLIYNKIDGKIYDRMFPREEEDTFKVTLSLQGTPRQKGKIDDRNSTFVERAVFGASVIAMTLLFL